MECSNEIKNSRGVDWFKDPSGKCYPAIGADNGYSNIGACLASPPSCAPNDCPYEAEAVDVIRIINKVPVTVSVPTNGCMASTPASVQENYSSCCRPQPYVGLNQTWKQQGKFDL